MKPNRSLPGERLLLYGGSIAGALHAVRRSASEAGAPTEQIDPTTHAEQRDVNTKGVVIASVGLLLTLWAIVLLIYPLFTYFKYERTGGLDPEKVLAYLPPSPPIPRNEDHPHQVLHQFRAQNEYTLHSYNWADRNHGLVTIPIERAIELLLQRGIAPSSAAGAEYYAPSAGSKRTGYERKVRPEPR